MMNVWEPLKGAFQKGDMEDGVRTFINGVLGQGTFDRLPAMVRAAMMDNAQELKAETLSPGYFSTFACEMPRK